MKNIKTIFYVLMIFLPFFFSFKKKNTRFIKIDVPYRINYYEFEEGVFSQIDYSCDEFENRDGVHMYSINDNAKIHKLIKELSKAKPAPEFNNKINVRRKLIVFYKSGYIDTICMAYTHTILKKGISMQLPIDEFSWDDFYKIIDSK